MFAHQILLVLFILFVLVWGSTNHYPWKSYVRLIGKSGKVRLLFNFILVIQLFYPILLPLPERFIFLGMNTTGVVIAFIGMAFAVWAKLVMKKSWGVPGQHDATMQPHLITHGPFRFSRNPIYVGLFLFLVGFELGMASWLILTGIPVAVMIHRAVMKEEKRLAEVFGDPYYEYCSRVRRYL